MVNLRRLSPADAELSRSLRLLALQECPTAFASSFEEESRFEAQRWLDRLAPSPDRFTLGALAGNELVGVVGFFREQRPKIRHRGNLVGMYVHPDWRGQGLGRRLVTALVTEAPQIEGVEQIILAVTAGNTAAKRLYEACGFSVFGVEPRALHVGERYYDEGHMVLLLGGTSAGG